MINMKEGDEILDINQYIEERLNNQIQWYSQKSQHAQKMYKIFQVTEIIIAAAMLQIVLLLQSSLEFWVPLLL